MKDFLVISEFYCFSTDIEIGINPTAKMMWVTLKRIGVDPPKVSNLVPIQDGDDYSLPLKLQADTGTTAKEHPFAQLVLDCDVAGVILAFVKSAPSFAKEVKELRRFLGISQKELAKALGVSYATINRWEMGHTEPHNLVREHFKSL